MLILLYPDDKMIGLVWVKNRQWLSLTSASSQSRKKSNLGINEISSSYHPSTNVIMINEIKLPLCLLKIKYYCISLRHYSCKVAFSLLNVVIFLNIVPVPSPEATDGHCLINVSGCKDALRLKSPRTECLYPSKWIQLSGFIFIVEKSFL